MIRTVRQRLAATALLATALVAGGLPVLTGTAHAATITPTPSTVENDAPHTFTINNATAPLLVNGATLTKSGDPTVTITATTTTSTANQVKATFPLYRALPGKYNLALNGVAANSCSSCVTIVGLDAALDLTTPAKVFPGDPDRALGSVHLSNPLRGAKYAKGRIQLTFSSVANLKNTQFFVYDATNSASPQQIDLTPTNGTLVGYVGPASGTVVDQGYDVTTPLQFRLTTGSPSGTLHVLAEFGDAAADGTLTNVYASEATNIVLPAYSKGSVFQATNPMRVLDTRLPSQGPALAAGEARTFNLSTLLPDATAVLLNVTTRSDTQFGTVTVYPLGANPSKGEGNVAYRPGRSISNFVSSPLSDDRKLVIRNNGTSTVNVMVDVEGYYTNKNSIPGSTYTPVVQKRLLDTRQSPNTVVQPGQALTVTPAGLPANTTAIAVNIIVLSPSTYGSVTAYPKGASRPVAATSVNFPASRAVNNFAVVKLGGSPAGITVRNDSAGTLHILVDMYGYFAPTGGAVFHPTAITRAIDTRDGTGTVKAPLPGRGGRTISLAGKGGVPISGATFVQLNVTAVNPAGSGNLVVFPGDAPMPPAGTSLYFVGENSASTIFVRLPANGLITFSNTGATSVELVVDVLGWGNVE
ncbi:MAG: hypothetical protein QOG53_1796 [Frankiales bacterium]|jgi:hypothetical protein|nr:hypothetical protein [Frankiales bacterium]